MGLNLDVTKLWAFEVSYKNGINRFQDLMEPFTTTKVVLYGVVVSCGGYNWCNEQVGDRMLGITPTSMTWF